MLSRGPPSDEDYDSTASYAGDPSPNAACESSDAESDLAVYGSPPRTPPGTPQGSPQVRHSSSPPALNRAGPPLAEDLEITSEIFSDYAYQIPPRTGHQYIIAARSNKPFLACDDGPELGAEFRIRTFVLRDVHSRDLDVYYLTDDRSETIGEYPRLYFTRLHSTGMCTRVEAYERDTSQFNISLNRPEGIQRNDAFTNIYAMIAQENIFLDNDEQLTHDRAVLIERLFYQTSSTSHIPYDKMIQKPIDYLISFIQQDTKDTQADAGGGKPAAEQYDPDEIPPSSYDWHGAVGTGGGNMEDDDTHDGASAGM